MQLIADNSVALACPNLVLVLLIPGIDRLGIAWDISHLPTHVKHPTLNEVVSEEAHPVAIVYFQWWCDRTIL